MSLYSVTGDTMTGIADAVRNMRHEKKAMTPAQIEAKIRASRLGIPIVVSTHINPETGEWERPVDWPDIDALAAQIVGDVDCVYLTYDLRKTPGYGWIGLYAETADNSAWTAERGHIENGAFVADETISTASKGYLRRALVDAEGSVQIWRISSTGHITAIGFCPNTGTNADNYQNNLQPCVQRAGTLPWCVRWAGSVGVNYNFTCGGTMWLERDALKPGKNAVVKDLSSCWNACYSLQSLDVSGWDTTNWAVTNLSYCWNSCYSLQSLDLSGWDTTNWAVTDLSYCWASCYSLQSLDVSGWDTTNWAVTNNSSMFASCQNLRALKIPDFHYTASNNNNYSPNLPNLETFNGDGLMVNHSYNAALKLTVASLVAIIAKLPTVKAARTLTLGQNKLKLTAEQIAVATQKGWTVA